MQVRSTIAALALTPALVWATPPGSDFTVATVDTICISLKQLTEITYEAQELPYVRGQSHPIMTEGAPLSMVIFVNPTTGTFTIAERVAQDAYCLLALGSRFEPVPKAAQDRIRKEQEKSRL
jgi:hypothetical protein